MKIIDEREMQKQKIKQPKKKKNKDRTEQGGTEAIMKG